MVVRREFKQGRIYIQPKLEMLTYATETSPKGKRYFKGKPILGNPIKLSPNARESELNKKYFRLASKKEINKIKGRFRF